MAQADIVRSYDWNPIWKIFNAPERNADRMHVIGAITPRTLQERMEYSKRPVGLLREKSLGIPARRYISSIHAQKTRRGIMIKRIIGDFCWGW
jgi:hypothetical protein